jgi:hypothetical protein
MQTTAIKRGETFRIAGEEYVVKDGRLWLNLLGFENLTGLEGLELQSFGKMYYYQLAPDRYVLYDCRRYPCFDSYDSMYENRCYRAFYLCRSIEEMQAKHDYLTSGKLFFYNENPDAEYREPLVPYVYFDDGKGTFWVYE